MERLNQNRTRPLQQYQLRSQTTLDPLWRLPRIGLAEKPISEARQKEKKSGRSPDDVLKIATLEEIYCGSGPLVDSSKYPMNDEMNRSKAWRCNSPCSLCYSESSRSPSPFNLTLRSGDQIKTKKVCSPTPVLVFVMSCLILLGIIGAILYMKLVIGS